MREELTASRVLRAKLAALPGQPLAKPDAIHVEGVSEMERELATAQERIRNLELDRLRQEERIRVLESALHAENSTVTTSIPPSGARSPSTTSLEDVSAAASGKSEQDTFDLPSGNAQTEKTNSTSGFESLLNMSALRTRSHPSESVDLDSKSSSEEESSDCSDDEAESGLTTPRSMCHSLSIPSTPELPVRDPSPVCSDAAANFFHQHLPAEMPSHGRSTNAEVTPMMPAPPFMRAPSCNWYCVAFISGIDIRADPHVDGRRTGVILQCGVVFAVSESLIGYDGRVYLRLADGRGWAFDDTALIPEDPSVVKVSPDAGGLLATVPLATPPVASHYTDLQYAQPAASPIGGSFVPYHSSHNMPPCPPFDADLSFAASSLQPVARHWKRGKRGGAKRRKRGGVKHRARPSP